MGNEITVWITKHALTKGVLVADGEVHHEFKQMFTVRGKQDEHYHGDGIEWHRTRESAIRRAEEMRLSKIKALRKKIEKLEGMNFHGVTK